MFCILVLVQLYQWLSIASWAKYNYNYIVQIHPWRKRCHFYSLSLAVCRLSRWRSPGSAFCLPPPSPRTALTLTPPPPTHNHTIPPCVFSLLAHLNWLTGIAARVFTPPPVLRASLISQGWRGAGIVPSPSLPLLSGFTFSCHVRSCLLVVFLLSTCTSSELLIISFQRQADSGVCLKLCRSCERENPFDMKEERAVA